MSGSKSPPRQKPASATNQPKSADAARTDRESSSSGGTSTGTPPTDVVEFEFEPATSSEVRTKLELARTFVDMGDPASARHILDEVLEEGNAAQKQEAQQLIDSLP